MPNTYLTRSPYDATTSQSARAGQAMMGIEIVHCDEDGSTTRSCVVALKDFLRPLFPTPEPASAANRSAMRSGRFVG